VKFLLCDQGSLRDGKEEANDYAVPHGDWFEIVSSPHYLAEIVRLPSPPPPPQKKKKKKYRKRFK